MRQNETEAALRESESRYRSLFEDSASALWEEDFSDVRDYVIGLRSSGIKNLRDYFIDHPEEVQQCAKLVKVIDVNKAVLDLHKAKDKKELLGSLGDFLLEDALDIFREEIVALDKGLYQFESETRLMTLAGEERDVIVRLNTPPEYEDSWARVFVCMTDINERKQMETQLRAREEEYRTLLRSISDVIFVFDNEDHFSHYYASDQSFIASSLTELLGKHVKEVLPPDAISSYTELAKEVRRTGSAGIFDYQLETGDKMYWFSSNLSLHEDGESIVAVVRNVTDRRRVEEALLTSEIRYRTLIENIPIGVYRTSQGPPGRFLMSNPALRVMLGYESEEDFHEMDVDDLYVNASERETLSKNLLKRGSLTGYEIHLQRRNGTPILASVTARVIRDESGKVTYFDGTIEDVTERKRTEEALQESEAITRSLFNAIPDLKLHISRDGTFLDFGQSSGPDDSASTLDLVGKSVSEFMPERAAHDTKESVVQALETGEIQVFEYDVPMAEGIHYFETRVVPSSENEVLALVRDITVRKRAEEGLRSSLQEKELLLREIHHRVNNNLQVVRSLLYLQAEKLHGGEDHEAYEIFRESQNRVRSMSLIHEVLYQSDNLAKIDFSDYVRSLISGLYGSFGIDSNRILSEIDICDISLGIDLATPCGLVITELVTNALKYAFPNDEKGLIRVILKLSDTHEFELEVSDNGVGAPENLDLESVETLGLRMVKSLVETQLEGTIEIDSSAGTRFVIKFVDQEQMDV